jgi:protein subunit release factor A
MEDLIDKRKRERNLNDHSSETDMLRIIEDNRRNTIMDTAKKLLELREVEMERNTADEFENTAPEEIKAAYQKEIDNIQKEIEDLEKKIKESFKEEDAVITTGILAGSDPASEYLLGKN